MDNSIDSTVTITIFALVAQIERELICLRTIEALHARLQAGVQLGHPNGKDKSKLDEHTDDILLLLLLKYPKQLLQSNMDVQSVICIFSLIGLKKQPNRH